jgi:hypothetical protein
MAATMLVFRSLTLGLLAACFLLLAIRPVYEVRVTRDARPQREAPAPPAATIIDVAAGVSASQLPAMLALAPDERVVAVDDQSVGSDLDAGTLLASRELDSQRYIDLEVEGARGARRLLVLLH